MNLLKADLLAASAKLDTLEPGAPDYETALAAYLKLEQAYRESTAAPTLCTKRQAIHHAVQDGYLGPVLMPSKGKTMVLPVPGKCVYVRWMPHVSPAGERLFAVVTRPVDVGFDG